MDESKLLFVVKMRSACQQLKRIGQQKISREQRMPFGVDLVQCGLATAQIIVVHARKVIMDEGIGMDHLKSTGGNKRKILHDSITFTDGEKEQGSQPFPGGKQSIASCSEK